MEIHCSACVGTLYRAIFSSALWDLHCAFQTHKTVNWDTCVNECHLTSCVFGSLWVCRFITQDSMPSCDISVISHSSFCLLQWWTVSSWQCGAEDDEGRGFQHRLPAPVCFLLSTGWRWAGESYANDAPLNILSWFHSGEYNMRIENLFQWYFHFFFQARHFRNFAYETFPKII